MNLRTIYETYKEHFDNAQPSKSNKKKRKKELTRNHQVESAITDAQISTIQSHYPTDYTLPPVSLSTMSEDEDIVESQGLQPVEMKSIESNLNEIVVDENRIVHPNAGLSGLYEFVPATKIKGNLYIIRKISHRRD